MEMKKIKIAYLKEMLFQLSVQKIALAISTSSANDIMEKELMLTDEHRDWFDACLRVAESEIRSLISTLLQESQCQVDEQSITYTLHLTHPFQREYIADLIEVAMVGLICKKWFDHRAIPIDLNEDDLMRQLKSCVLKTTGSKGRKFSIM